MDTIQIAQVLEAVLEAMKPPIEVYAGILQAIAELAGTRYRFTPTLFVADRALITNNGKTARLKHVDDWNMLWGSIGVLPKIVTGKNRIIFRMEEDPGHGRGDDLGFGIRTMGYYHLIYYFKDGTVRIDHGTTTVSMDGMPYGVNDQIEVEVDMTNQTVVFYKNGTQAVVGPIEIDPTLQYYFVAFMHTHRNFVRILDTAEA